MKRKFLHLLTLAAAGLFIGNTVQAQTPTANRFSTQDFRTWSIGLLMPMPV